MKTVLITGGGSGIGAGLAGAFDVKGAQVIIAGRSRDRLEVVASKYPGMTVEVVDVAEADQVGALAERMTSRWPALDTVVNNAGIQTLLDFREAVDP